MAYIRRCSVCGKFMVDGYVFDNGREYYCDDECRDKEMTEQEWYDLCDESDDSYWTEWFDEDDTEYQELKKIIMEIAWEKAPSNEIMDYSYRNMFEATMNLLVIKKFGIEGVAADYLIDYYDSVQILNETIEIMDKIMED